MALFPPVLRSAWTIAIRSTWTVLRRTISRSGRSPDSSPGVDEHAASSFSAKGSHVSCLKPRCSSVMISSAISTARRTTDRSCRTLPGQSVGQHRLDRRRGKTLDGLGKLDVGNIQEPLRQVRVCPPCARAAAGWRSCIRSTGSKGRDGRNRFRKVARGRWLLAASIRTSTWMGLVPPSRYRVLSWSTRSSLAWEASGILEISSRKSVPVCAASIFPAVC